MHSKDTPFTRTEPSSHSYLSDYDEPPIICLIAGTRVSVSGDPFTTPVLNDFLLVRIKRYRKPERLWTRLHSTCRVVEIWDVISSI